ncbi:MAG: hypothetical protein PHS14_18145, partial [Elusimicrobia bacterium]|nr:hypothetical protein [Elusimicrobiota bacterium]
REVTFPASREVLTNELLNFEYDTTAAGNLVYSAPEGGHDDSVLALALTIWGAFRAQRRILLPPQAPPGTYFGQPGVRGL